MKEKHYCQCGCGQEVGVWGFTSRTYGFVKGQPKKYIVGHNSKRRKKLKETNKYTFQDGFNFAEMVKRQAKKVGELIPVDIYWTENATAGKQVKTVQGKVVEIYENFYLVNMGNYKTTQSKVDVALMGRWMA
ncbi:hypothetical protein [Candidatus Oleimmundimicrobium sp.]|uniref:hypothetical protein n=1 Tax=Candidatus Oleimmundimicrobium sp. TaxID=3060597 RepID=UPI00272103CB|nr:hypothetical protein [Candidatus Oleimmundimicrobium sp.]MDO8885758.1 hypothetical protein [Candidatus Oleimmundimicrobium sp.]